MIIPDANLLIYAYDERSQFHRPAADWWTRCLNGTERVGLPWMIALGFVRLVTSPRVFANPMNVDDATRHVETWLNRRCVAPLNPGPLHGETVFRLLRAEGRGGNLTTDAHLAALAIEHRGTLYSNDLDFQRFPEVRLVNPLK